MYVYVIGSDNGPQKIGVAAKPESRLCQLRTGSPFPLAIRAMFDMTTENNARLVERTAHHRLKDRRMAGEWFNVPAEEAIDMVRVIVASVLDGSIHVPPARITPAQIRAGRSLLGWKQTDLAKAAEVSEISIKNIERGTTDPRGSTLSKIQSAFTAAGVQFLDPGQHSLEGGHGVRLIRRQ